MEYIVLLASNAHLPTVEAEEQTRFILSVVEALEIPFEWDSNEQMTVLDKIRLRKFLKQYNISILDDLDGGVKIYSGNEKIAEWKKAAYKLKEDLQQIDPKKKLYIEMKCKFESNLLEHNE